MPSLDFAILSLAIDQICSSRIVDGANNYVTYRVKFEWLSDKIDRTVIFIHYCLDGSRFGYWLSGEGIGANGESDESGGDLHGSLVSLEMKVGLVFCSLEVDPRGPVQNVRWAYLETPC